MDSAKALQKLDQICHCSCQEILKQVQISSPHSASAHRHMAVAGGAIFPTSVPKNPFGCRNAPTVSNEPREPAGTTVCTPDLCRYVILPPDLQVEFGLRDVHRRRRSIAVAPLCTPQRTWRLSSANLWLISSYLLCNANCVHHVNLL